MAIKNVEVVNVASKYIVKSTGIGSEDKEKMIEPSKGKYGAVKLEGGDTDSKVSLIECYHLIEGTGTMTISAGDKTLTLTGKGKYGLRPEQLKFGNDKIFKLAVTPEVESYLLVTEFRRN